MYIITGGALMNTFLKVLKYFFLSLIIVVVAFLAVLQIMSPAKAGKELTEKKGLVWRTVIGHRGSEYWAPENTVAAFALARELGADYLETDVQRTKDGKLIVFHDDDFARNTNCAEVFPGREKDPIGTFTYAEMMKLDVGTWYNKKNPTRARESFKGTKIPTFDQYISSAEGSVNQPGLLIELKKPSAYPGIEKEIIAALTKRGWIGGKNNIPADAKGVTVGYGPARVVLQSFEYPSVVLCKKLAPQVPANYLVDENKPKNKETDWSRGWDGILDDCIAAHSELGPVGYMMMRPWYIGKAHKRGLSVIVWTLDSNAHFNLAKFTGVDWYITNRTDLALKALGRPAPSVEECFKKLNL